MLSFLRPRSSTESQIDALQDENARLRAENARFLDYVQKYAGERITLLAANAELQRKVETYVRPRGKDGRFA